MLAARPAAPGPGFTSALYVATWLDVTHAVPVAWLLIGHPGPRRAGETPAGVEAGLLAMAGAMGLAPAAEQVPDIGDRLVIGGRVVALDYGHADFCLRLPRPHAPWREHIARRGPGCVALVLDPLPSGAGEPYLERACTLGRALLGAVTVRTRQRPAEAPQTPNVLPPP